MMKGKYVLFSLLFCVSIVRAEPPISLHQAIDMAQDYNIDVKKASFEKYASHARVDQAYSAYWPKVDMVAKSDNQRIKQSPDYRTSSDQQSQISAALLYTLYDFGARSAEVDAAKYSLEGTVVKEALQKEVLIYDAFKAFVQYDFAQLNYGLAEKYLVNVTKLHTLITQRVEAGYSAQSDKVRGELALSEATARVKTALQGLTDSRIELSNAIGLNPEKIDSLLARPFQTNLDVNDITLQSNVNNPSIKIMLSNARMYESKIASIKAERYPKIQIVGTYRHNFNRENFPGSEAYIQVVVPLTDGGMLRSRVRESVNNHQVAKLTLQQAHRDLDKRQRDFINIYQSARDKLIIDQKSAEQAKRTLDIYQAEFSLGSRPLTDLINAQKDLLKVDIDILNDKINAYLSVLSLYNLNGDTMACINLFVNK